MGLDRFVPHAAIFFREFLCYLLMDFLELKIVIFSRFFDTDKQTKKDKYAYRCNFVKLNILLKPYNKLSLSKILLETSKISLARSNSLELK